MTLLENAPLQSRNSLRLVANARAVCAAESVEQIEAAIDWAANHQLSVMPWGEGSNVVLAGDLDALVLNVRSQGIELLDRNHDSVLLRVAAGEHWHSFVQWSLGQGYFGLENLALIPGSVGAAPIQNIGAYGVEVAEFIDTVHGLLLEDGRPFALSAQDCHFRYRDSIFKTQWRDGAIITAVDLRLPLHAAPNIRYSALARHLQARSLDAPTAQQVCDAVIDIRRTKLPDPAVLPNAGSFFKNPVLEASAAAPLLERYPQMPTFQAGDGAIKFAAAWMIEHCGWKGQRRNGVGVHPQHALVLVNYGADSGAELLSLADDIAADVQATFGIELAIEPRVYGSRHE